jgi:hypothetical protein
VPAAGFETAIPASERHQTQGLNSAATGIGVVKTYYGEKLNTGNGDRLSSYQTEAYSCLQTTSITSALERENLSA